MTIGAKLRRAQRARLDRLLALFQEILDASSPDARHAAIEKIKSFIADQKDAALQKLLARAATGLFEKLAAELSPVARAVLNNEGLDPDDPEVEAELLRPGAENYAEFCRRLEALIDRKGRLS